MIFLNLLATKHFVKVKRNPACNAMIAFVFLVATGFSTVSGSEEAPLPTFHADASLRHIDIDVERGFGKIEFTTKSDSFTCNCYFLKSDDQSSLLLTTLTADQILSDDGDRLAAMLQVVAKGEIMNRRLERSASEKATRKGEGQEKGKGGQGQEKGKGVDNGQEKGKGVDNATQPDSPE